MLLFRFCLSSMTKLKIKRFIKQVTTAQSTHIKILKLSLNIVKSDSGCTSKFVRYTNFY